MVSDLARAKQLVYLTGTAEKLLTSSKRPIVLCPAKRNSGLSPLVAPGQNALGIMLPYTPLHHLLLEHFDALIMHKRHMSDASFLITTKPRRPFLTSLTFSLCTIGISTWPSMILSLHPRGKST